MKRETTNLIRTILEEALPPALRDSAAMRWLFRQRLGSLVDETETFRARMPFVTPEEYRSIYERMPRVHDETDNSQACLDRILSDLTGKTVLDVGCGTGHLAGWLQRNRPGIALTGADFIIDEATRARHPNVDFVEGPIEKLPFGDASFDTVICTHVLEHIFEFNVALAELRRVAGKRLIVVVPQEREYRFTPNAHLHFFPYPHSFLRHLAPPPDVYVVESIGRDIYYREDRMGSAAS